MYRGYSLHDMYCIWCLCSMYCSYTWVQQCMFLFLTILASAVFKRYSTECRIWRFSGDCFSNPSPPIKYSLRGRHFEYWVLDGSSLDFPRLCFRGFDSCHLWEFETLSSRNSMELKKTRARKTIEIHLRNTCAISVNNSCIIKNKIGESWYFPPPPPQWLSKNKSSSNKNAFSTILWVSLGLGCEYRLRLLYASDRKNHGCPDTLSVDSTLLPRGVTGSQNRAYRIPVGNPESHKIGAP